MKLVVIGGSGRSGTYVLRQLVAHAEHQVTVFDRVAPSVGGVR
jgi:uncharacterized protein YbjT (DUF2867 family)